MARWRDGEMEKWRNPSEAERGREMMKVEMKKVEFVQQQKDDKNGVENIIFFVGKKKRKKRKKRSPGWGIVAFISFYV